MDKADFIQVLVAVVTTMIASSGFWAYLMKRSSKNDATTRLLMGLAYDKITYLGMRHIENGSISNDEYNDFRKYLYDPYKELGGNGTVDRIMQGISELPIVNHHQTHIELE